MMTKSLPKQSMSSIVDSLSLSIKWSPDDVWAAGKRLVDLLPKPEAIFPDVIHSWATVSGIHALAYLYVLDAAMKQSDPDWAASCGRAIAHAIRPPIPFRHDQTETDRAWILGRVRATFEHWKAEKLVVRGTDAWDTTKTTSYDDDEPPPKVGYFASRKAARLAAETTKQATECDGKFPAAWVPLDRPGPHQCVHCGDVITPEFMEQENAYVLPSTLTYASGRAVIHADCAAFREHFQ